MSRYFAWPRAAKILPAVCLATAVFGAAPAAAATEFFGGGFVTDFSQACNDHFLGSIQMVTARYMPSGLPGNGNSTSLTLLAEPGAINYSTEGRFSGSFTPVNTVGIFAEGGVQTNPLPRLRLTPGSSINIGAGTEMILLNGEVSEPLGCTMRFRVYMSRHN